MGVNGWRVRGWLGNGNGGLLCRFVEIHSMSGLCGFFNVFCVAG